MEPPAGDDALRGSHAPFECRAIDIQGLEREDFAFRVLAHLGHELSARFAPAEEWLATEHPNQVRLAECRQREAHQR